MPDNAYRYLLDLHGFSHHAGLEGKGFACTIQE